MLIDQAPFASWHAAPVSEVSSHLETDADTGLDDPEGRRRLIEHGPNQLVTTERWGRLRRLANQFQDVLIWLLLAAAAISGFVLGAWVDATAIAIIVALNAVIGYAQEARAQTALDRLRDMEAPHAVVIREGLATTVEARDLVPGDVVAVETGDRIPADGRVVSGLRLLVDEAPLTGESMPVAKTNDPVDDDTVLAERTSMLYAGTIVVAGRGRVIVTATGMGTEMGRIAGLFTDEQPRTPLQNDLARIGRRLALLAGAAALLIFVAGLARSFPVERMALTAVALAVAAIPEGLPAVITVSLAGGLQRMARRNAIVRRLPAVETLGSVNVICTDKTGTLTAPELETGGWWFGDGNEWLPGLRQGSGEMLAMTAVLCNNAVKSPGGWSGDPTETALLESLESSGVDVDEIRDGSPRLDEAAFDSRRKRMSTLHGHGDETILLVKGAPEIVLARSSSVATDDGVVPMNAGLHNSILARAEGTARKGMRTLAFAVRRMGTRPDDPAESEDELTFVGMVGLRERIRPEVGDAVDRAARAGVRTVMVTGDHATTAAAIADQVGIGSEGLVEGNVLSKTTVASLTESVEEHHVYARVDPADKVKIIEAWQATGAKVAMTGDGVNDAPALHRADIGVAMGSGTDVARESAAMVLTDDNYATIVEAIAEGRRLFSNLRNVVHYLLSANASEVLFVLVGFLAFGFMGEPLLAVQLLWINLISDALPAIALGMESPVRDLMTDPPGTGRDVLSTRNTTILLAQGVLLAASAVIALLAGAYWLDLDHPSVQTMVFTTLVFSQLLHALSVRARTAETAGRARRPGWFLIGAIAGSALLHLVVVYSGPGNTFFSTVPLGWEAMIWTVSASLLSVLLVRLFNRVIDSGRSSE